ncbi:MAG TPA: sugar transferase [Stellaceae bacterium]|nr:sugar transferase [Stellaceae bacterium]
MSGVETARSLWRRRKHSLPPLAIGLAIIETVLLGGATYLLLLSTDPSNDPYFPDWIGLGIAIAFIAAIATSTLNLWRHKAPEPRRRVIMSIPVALGFTASIGFLVIFIWIGGEPSGNETLLRALKALLAWALCLCLTRSIAAHLPDFGMFKRRILVVGNGLRAREIARLATARARFTPVGFVDDAYCLPTAGLAGGADAGALLRTARALRVSEVVVATEERRGVPVVPLLQCKAEGIDVLDYPAFFERESGRVDLDALQPSWFLFSDGLRTGLLAGYLKRGLDVTLSLAVLLLALPVLLLAFAILMLAQGRPVLEREERVGWRGRPFFRLRFRTGRLDASPSAPPLWPGAARRGWFGALFHRLRIDELPQFWNVIRGDMSLVGPRAERPVVAELYAREIPFYCARHAMRPGLTGWAQINHPYGATLADARQKLSFDLYYLKNWSLRRDLLVLMESLGFALHSGSR